MRFSSSTVSLLVSVTLISAIACGGDSRRRKVQRPDQDGGLDSGAESDNTGGRAGVGGAVSSAGSPGMGTAGQVGTAGASAIGGGGAVGAAGAAGNDTGGVPATGGAPATGGLPATGGTEPAGGAGGEPVTDAGALLYQGLITVSTALNGESTVSSYYGTFTPYEDPNDPTVCNGTASGDCCFVPAPTVGGSFTPKPLSAGLVTGTRGGTSSSMSWLETPLADGGVDARYQDPAGNLTWTPGDTVTITGAGDVADAFTASIVTVAPPGDIQPAFVGTQSQETYLAVANESGWGLTWTPDTFSDAPVVLSMNQDGVGSVTCRVVDSGGSLTVPADLLQRYAAGARLVVRFTRTGNTQVVRAGNVQVTINATAYSDTNVLIQ